MIDVISRLCPLVAVILWPMCRNTGMPCRRHRTRHPTPSQFTDTGPTSRCAIHWFGTSHWNTQVPNLMSWVWPDSVILRRPSTHSAKAHIYDAVVMAVSQKLGRKCTVPPPPSLEPGTCGRGALILVYVYMYVLMNVCMYVSSSGNYKVKGVTHDIITWKHFWNEKPEMSPLRTMGLV